MVLNPTLIHLQNHHKPLTQFQIDQIKYIFDIIDIFDIIIDKK